MVILDYKNVGEIILSEKKICKLLSANFIKYFS